MGQPAQAHKLVNITVCGKVDTSELMLKISSYKYIPSITEIWMGQFNTYSPIYCKSDKVTDRTNHMFGIVSTEYTQQVFTVFTRSLNEGPQCLLSILYYDDNEKEEHS